MNHVVPWQRWIALIEPHYPKSGFVHGKAVINTIGRSVRLNEEKEQKRRQNSLQKGIDSVLSKTKWNNSEIKCRKNDPDGPCESISYLFRGFLKDANIPKLKTAGNDARAIAEVLKSEYGFDDIALLIGQEANATEIERSLRRLITQSKEMDNVY